MSHLQRALVSYPEYQFLYPPRPEKLLASRFAWPRTLVQIKKNGHCVLVAVRGDEVIVRTRHNKEPYWTPKLRFPPLNGSAWFVFCGELLRDRVYLFDCLVWNGYYLLGYTHIDRQYLLDRLGRGRISNVLEVARNYPCPREAASKLVDGEDEGLVFRKGGIGLAPCVTPGANSDGLWKWRK